MKYIKNSVALIVFFFILMSCKKGSENEAAKIAPSNLVITAVPTTDGSGKVAFSATADNAISYAYEFGNGDIKSIAFGSTTYQYSIVGTNIYTVTVTASSSAGLTLKKSTQVTITTIAAVPVLVWSEEFNIDGAPDSAKWGYDIGKGDWGWGNNELEYYTNRRENSIVQGGVLKVTAQKEDYAGSNYTSARLITKEKFAFTYGRVEIRAKMVEGVGTWPATWMLGTDNATNGWPKCGEIDIMEHLGRTLNTIYGTLHYPGRSGGNADGTTLVIANAATEFHIYSMDWNADAIKLYVDGVLFHTTVNSASMPFNHDFFFIVNMALGGNFGGPLDPAFTKATMEVDYIRVYK